MQLSPPVLDAARTPHPTAPRRPGTTLLALAIALVVATQIAWPLTRSSLREHLTVTIVVGFAFVCVMHVAVTRSTARAALVLAITAVPGFAVEVVGVHTGFPFGSYAYSDVFGLRLFDVPLVIALAWTMMCWPAALAARRLVSGRVPRVLLGAWATTAGDFFLDPQLVATGAWRWDHPSPHLPGVPDIPLTNYAGWLLATVVLSALVQAVMGDGDDSVGIGLFLWSWVSWTVALAVFLQQPAAAAWGALAMGTVGVPLLSRLINERGIVMAKHNAHSATLEREFDATAERYDLMVALNPGYHEHLREAARLLCDRLPTDRPVRVVDLGCGSGASTAAVIDRLGAARAAAAGVVGIDASAGMLAVARGKSWPAGVRFNHGLAEDVADRADEWSIEAPLDGLFACYLFRNVTDRDATLAAVRDVLAPGGWLVVQDYSVAGSRRSIALWTFICWAVVIPLSAVLTGRTKLYRYLWRSVMRFDTVAVLEDRMRRAGFEDVTTSTVAGWQRGILHTVVARRSS